MRTLLRFGGWGLVAAIAWHIGGMIPAHTLSLLMGFLFGSFVGIPAMLLIAQGQQRRRVDIYHHNVPETPHEPVKRISEQDVIVLPPQQQRIAAAALPRIEVTR